MLRKSYRFIRNISLEARGRLLNRIDPPVVILIYHRVTTLPSDPQQLAVSPENFRAHMSYIKGSFPILRFEDDWSDIREPSVVITFDDGYADNLLEALPILDELAVPATFFVSTGSIDGKQEFWWDELERIILGEWRFNADFKLDVFHQARGWPTDSPENRQIMYREIHPLIKKMDAVVRDNLLGEMRAWSNADDIPRVSHRQMALHELKELSLNRWVTIGAHTVSHTPLSTLSVKRQSEEIVSSKKRLEEWLSKKITVFSYPFGGRADYTNDTVQLCKNAGFVKAASNFPGLAHSWTDPYQLPRQLVRNWPVELFVNKMGQFWIV